MHGKTLNCLYVGTFGPHCSDHYRVKGMFESGMNVISIDFRKTYAQRGPDGLVSDIVHEYYSFQPDFVLVNKGEKFVPEVLIQIRRIVDVPIFLFYGDKREHWPKYITNNLPYYDAFLINSDDEDEKKELKKKGARRIVYHHTATDIDTFYKQDVDEIVDVAFFGSNYNDLFPSSRKRREYINNLICERNVLIRIHGRSWGVNSRGVVFGDDYSKSASQAKMIIGFNAFEDIRFYTSNRAFNSMACGMYLSTPWKGCEEMFEEGKEIEFFRTYDEMLDKITYYKERPDERRKMYEAGRKKISKEHTYKTRGYQLAELYKEAVNGNTYTSVSA